MNLFDFFVECESFDKEICALKKFKGSFTFSFESDIDELKLNPKKLEQDIEICKKVWQLRNKYCGSFFAQIAQRLQFCGQITLQSTNGVEETLGTHATSTKEYKKVNFHLNYHRLVFILHLLYEGHCRKSG